MQFGSQCIVLAIDAKKAGPGNWHIVISGGRDDTGMDAVEWVKEGERLGAGEIVVNAIDTDGDKTGYSLELTKQSNKMSTSPSSQVVVPDQIPM